MDADANANANANANTNADAGGSTIALRDRCSGELKMVVDDIAIYNLFAVKLFQGHKSGPCRIFVLKYRMG